MNKVLLNLFFLHFYPMRKKLIAGNWKSNLAKSEAITLAKAIAKQSHSQLFDLAVFPPEVFIAAIAEIGAGRFFTGAQDCSAHSEGAFTGETTAAQLASAGVQMVITGHSERRQIFAETNKTVKAKVDKILEANLIPIFCCGEILETRQANEQSNFVLQQLQESLFHLNEESFSKIIIAYEPIWAIGTGVVASPKEAEEMHAFLRTEVEKKYSKSTAENLKILYGGSVKPNNAAELFKCQNVDGVLVGGASLKATDFLDIAGAVN